MQWRVKGSLSLAEKLLVDVKALGLRSLRLGLVQRFGLGQQRLRSARDFGGSIVLHELNIRSLRGASLLFQILEMSAEVFRMEVVESVVL